MHAYLLSVIESVLNYHFPIRKWTNNKQSTYIAGPSLALIHRSYSACMDQFSQSTAQACEEMKLRSSLKTTNLPFPPVAHRPFRFWWYFWLTLTGLGLGLTVSCKWVGLFTIATIGVSTIKNLWEIWGDTHVPLVSIGANLCKVW